MADARLDVSFTSREWSVTRGASQQSISTLRQRVPAVLPGDYFDLLVQSDGGEGPLPVQPLYCVLDDAETMVSNLSQDWHREWVAQGVFVIGGNGSGEFVALDLRTPGVTPVVAIDMVVGLDSIQKIADSVARLADLLGREA